MKSSQRCESSQGGALARPVGAGARRVSSLALQLLIFVSLWSTLHSSGAGGTSQLFHRGLVPPNGKKCAGWQPTHLCIPPSAGAPLHSRVPEPLPFSLVRPLPGLTAPGGRGASHGYLIDSPRRRLAAGSDSCPTGQVIVLASSAESGCLCALTGSAYTLVCEGPGSATACQISRFCTSYGTPIGSSCWPSGGNTTFQLCAGAPSPPRPPPPAPPPPMTMITSGNAWPREIYTINQPRLSFDGRRTICLQARAT